MNNVMVVVGRGDEFTSHCAHMLIYVQGDDKSFDYHKQTSFTTVLLMSERRTYR